MFYNRVINDSKGLTEKPVLPRQRRASKRYELNSRVSNFTTCEEFYHQQYIEALHIVVNMLRVRFTQSNFKLLCGAEKFLLNVSNNPAHDQDDLIQVIPLILKQNTNLFFLLFLSNYCKRRSIWDP